MGKSPVENEVELLPDAWERFERAVHTVAKGGPQHRSAKPSHEAENKMALAMLEKSFLMTEIIASALRSAGL